MRIWVWRVWVALIATRCISSSERARSLISRPAVAATRSVWGPGPRATAPLIDLQQGSDGILLSLRGQPSSSIHIKSLNKTIRIAAVDRVLAAPTDTYVAVFGFYQFPLGNYVAMVKRSSPLPELSALGNIHKVDEVELIRVGGSSASDDDMHVVEHRMQLKQLHSTFKRHQFLFSLDGYDILCSLQANILASPPSEASDRCFFWNKQACSPLAAIPQGAAFATKFVNAYVFSARLDLEGRKLALLLLARRSRRYQGPRYLKRGGNDKGDVANFVEIEQILVDVDERRPLSSFVQVRGSIPLRWSQPDAWKIKPGVQLVGAPSTPSQSTVHHQVDAVTHHLRQLARMYGLGSARPGGDVALCRLIVLNLVDKKGGQGALGRLWYEILLALHRRSLVPGVKHPAVATLDWADRAQRINQNFIVDLASHMLSVQYVWLDFHHELRRQGMPAVLQQISETVRADLEERSAFFIPGAGSNPQLQSTLVRSNCMDCLDRTNVVQTAVSRWVLLKQLQACFPSRHRAQKLLLIQPNKLPTETMDKAFRGIWTQLGDELSIVYAGSRAMKRDVTLNGVRTGKGMLDDALAFFRRYYSNNYRDQYKQIALDLLLGTSDEEIETDDSQLYQTEDVDPSCEWIGKGDNSDFTEAVDVEQGAIRTHGEQHDWRGFLGRLDAFFDSALSELAGHIEPESTRMGQ